jgi:nucleoid-associated protein YgaU
VRYLAFFVLLASVFIAGCASSRPKNSPKQVINPEIQQSTATAKAAEQPVPASVPQQAAIEQPKPEPAKQPEAASPERGPQEGDRIHKVWIFESLWSISKKYYGDGKYWETIYEANKDQIKDPKVIFPRQELVIPPLEAEK